MASRFLAIGTLAVIATLAAAAAAVSTFRHSPLRPAAMAAGADWMGWRCSGWQAWVLRGFFDCGRAC